MPKSRVKKSKLFREFSKLDAKYVNNNHLKDFRSTRIKFCEDNNIAFRNLEFLLWAYDLEFFTISHASEEYGIQRGNLGNRYVFPLMKDGYIYKHFDRLTPNETAEDHLFRDETKYNYRVRYAISQRSRLLVQRFYRQLVK